MAYSGVPRATIAFLSDLADHNTKEWFLAHRAGYDEDYVGAGRDLIEAAWPIGEWILAHVVESRPDMLDAVQHLWSQVSPWIAAIWRTAERVLLESANAECAPFLEDARASIG